MNLQSNIGLVSKLLNNEAFRDAYVFEHIKTGIAYQIRAMRDEREWTQGRLGEEAKKPRNVITRLEDPNYGQFSLQTLREIASAFDVALLVKFVSFSTLLQEYADVSPQALVAASVKDSKEVGRLKRWAAAKDKNDSEAISTTVDSEVYKSVVTPSVSPVQPDLGFMDVKPKEFRFTGNATVQTNVISIKSKRPVNQKRVVRHRRRAQPNTLTQPATYKAVA